MILQGSRKAKASACGATSFINSERLTGFLLCLSPKLRTIKQTPIYWRYCAKEELILSLVNTSVPKDALFPGIIVPGSALPIVAPFLNISTRMRVEAMIRSVYRFYPPSQSVSPVNNLFAYFRFVGYRCLRGFIQVADGFLSIFLAPLGMDTELYADFICWVEKRRKPQWNQRYHKP